MAPQNTIIAGDKNKIGNSDIVFALPACQSWELLSATANNLRTLMKGALAGTRAVLLYSDRTRAAPPDDSAETESPLALLPHPFAPVEVHSQQLLDQAIRSLLPIGKPLGARVFVILVSDVTPTTAADLWSLAEPVLNHGYDLAIPLYPLQNYSALINRSIVSPLARALYGARLRYPMAVNFAISAKLADLYQQASSGGPAQPEWVTTKAVCAGLQVCQVHWDGAPVSAGAEAGDLSASLAQILGANFLELERHAGFWQRVRGSQPIRTFGLARSVESENASVDVRPMLQTFQRGCRDLLDIWAVVLSPAALVELRKLARLPENEFRLGDELWANVVYDFILGHRQRLINREHLLRSITPLYLGWVASYALELRRSPAGNPEERFDALCAAFEKLKPYLLSRWRSPDRFNP